MNGIHEVVGSIPSGSTIYFNGLANQWLAHFCFSKHIVSATAGFQLDLPPLHSPTDKKSPFWLWSALDRVANSFGVSPSRLVCGLLVL